MVRTRPRNKTRRIAVIDYGSDGEPPEAHEDPDDDNFEAPPPDPEDDEDDRMDLDGGGDDDFEAEDPSSLAIDAGNRDFDDEDDERPAYTSSAGLRKRQGDMAALEKYHADGRPTRYYTGALKRGQRNQILDYFYGPDEEAIGIAGWLLSRWAAYGVLPSKVPGGDACPVSSPWLEEGHLEEQVEVSKVWFARISGGEGVTGAEREMSREEAEKWRVKPDGELKTVIGPYPEQKEVKIAPHECLVLSESGLPMEGEADEKVAGWMFDVGGLVISMDWALRGEGDSQILALAVSPHTDQQLDAEDAVDEQKGTIQLWELHGRTDKNGMLYSQNRSAKLARTVCSEWGRVKRIKWCPIPFTDDGSLGLMALLCGDGQVHVVSIKDIDDDEQDSFSKSLCYLRKQYPNT